MKKFFSFFLVLAILMTFSGCSKSKESSTSIESAHIQLGSADIDLAEDFSEIFCLDKNAERHLVFGELKSGEYGGCITDDQYKEEKAFRFIANENEKARAASLMNGDGISVITTMDSETMIYVLDSGSNVEHKYELGEVISPDDYYMEFLCFEDGFYINVARRKLVYVDIMGNLKGEVKTDGRNICGITTDRDGKPCVLLNDEEKMNIGKLVGCEIADEMSCDELGTGINAICSGEGEYRIVLVTISGLYALKEDEWLKLSDFSDNDFPIHNIYDVDTISDNEFVVLLNSGGKETELRRLYKRELSEIKQKKTIKVALTSGGNIDPYTPQIKKYNSENDEYKIEFVDYYTDSQEDTFNRLRLDIISGECPDIIIFSDYMTVESFGTEEYIFVDLYSLIDRDNEIGRDDFVDGFLESMETKGRLLQITPTFIIRTNMIKNKFANGLSSWDTEEFKEI